MTVSKLSKTADCPPRATSAKLDQLRARALRGDALRELTDSRREWVWRSLLKGTRIQEAVALVGMTSDDLASALERVRRKYQRRIDLYKQAQAQQPRVRMPVEKPATRSLRKRRGWWPFGA
jgi:predicted ATPase